MSSNRIRLVVGDVIAIPLEGNRVSVGQVVSTYRKEAYYFAVFDQTCEADDLSCIEEALGGQIVLLGLSLDAKISAGHWKVVGNREVEVERVPFPAYVEGVSPPGTFDVVDHSGTRRRRADSDEVPLLASRTVVAPVRLERAARALYGLEPWNTAYDELRVPSETTRSSFRFKERSDNKNSGQTTRKELGPNN